MDKSWMSKSRWSQEYVNGVESFLEFASQSKNTVGKILCPCKSCINRFFHSIDDVRLHLTTKGIFLGYVIWSRHGEDYNSSIQSILKESEPISTEIEENYVDTEELLNDTFMNDFVNPNLEDKEDEEDIVPPREDSSSNRLSEDAETELYPGCKNFTKLSFILHLFRLKCLHSWTARSFDMLLELLNDAFPEGTSLPKSTYEVKKVMKSFDLGYTKIEVCRNNCMLFWKDKAEQEICDICGSSRWADTQNTEGVLQKKKKVKATKIFRYFPLIPRLLRLYKVKKSSEDMIWHAKHRNKDGLLRHPADGAAWKKFDAQYPDFSSDPRSVRLGLSTDGFNPFKIFSSTYSVWPVVLVIYNLPPWIGMKQSSFILSMIIPGEKSPGNDIDIYLQPLIDELGELWKGVQCYDATNKEVFNMRASLMWTINDFPAYGMVSGWSTKGRYACPCCVGDTDSLWLKRSKKFSYMGHRRWLPPTHVFRQNHAEFDNTVEVRVAPQRLSGSEVLSQTENLSVIFGKLSKSQLKDLKKRKFTIVNDPRTDFKNWKKRSIFFNLPYWEFNLLPHNLDVMHIEKNICDNFLNTLLDLEKTKDNIQARLDLVDLGIHTKYHPQLLDNGSYYIPPMCTSMARKEKSLFCEVMKNLKLPKGYSSNISRCVNITECKIAGLKSHDCHVLIEDILPVMLKACSASDQLLEIVIDISKFFKAICATIIDPTQLDQLQASIVMSMCKMEKNFVPSFFTVMVHLLIHLVEEVKLGGPVQYRWMYPFERYAFTKFII